MIILKVLWQHLGQNFLNLSLKKLPQPNRKTFSNQFHHLICNAHIINYYVIKYNFYYLNSDSDKGNFAMDKPDLNYV